MEEFNPNDNLRNLSQETRNEIREAVIKTYAKMMPDTKSLVFLIQLFIENIEPNFTISCGKCKKRVIRFWMQSLKNWGMY